MLKKEKSERNTLEIVSVEGLVPHDHHVFLPISSLSRLEIPTGNVVNFACYFAGFAFFII